MEKRVVEKNKYIIYNEDKKILTFTSTTEEGVKHIAIPSFVVRGYEVNSTGRFYEAVKKQVISEEKLCFLGKSFYEFVICECENVKLKKESLKMIRNYYSCYREFTEEDYRIIMQLCYENNVLPEFFTIYEIKQLIHKQRNKKSRIDIDKNMMRPIAELDKRLKFIKY